MTPEQYALLLQVLIEDLVTVPGRIAEAYADGVAEGIELGKRIGVEEAERDMAKCWDALARKIRADAVRWTPYAEKRRRELEWAKPRSGDYTGRLTPQEYFGTGHPQATPERRAA